MYSGLEVLARVNEIILPLVLVFIVIIAGMVVLEMDSTNFLPLLEKGFLPPFKAALPAALFFSQSTVMLMFIPFLRNPSGALKSITQAVIAVGFFQMLVTIQTIGMFGGLLVDMEFPFLQLTRNISLAGGVFQRMEHFIMVIWVAGGFIKVGVFY